MKSKKKKILLVFGTRPEAIKMAPLVKEFEKHQDSFETYVCVTGQHRQMLDQVLNLFEIKPDFDLNIMQANQDLYDITSKILLGMREVLDDLNPDLVFVHGDTATSTAAALSAFYKQIPVVHVEAGLRTGNIYSPWPEEMNRLITSKLTTYHLSPTNLAKENLLKENIKENTIFVTGNTVIDALNWVKNKIQSDDNLEKVLNAELADFGYSPSRLSGDRKLLLITGHRRENFGDGFKHICEAINVLAAKYPQLDFVYPVHLNPNVRNPVMSIIGEDNENVFLIEPLDYLPFVYLMSRSHIILTDSGGIQEEAPGLKIPVLVMRNTTERPEAVEAGTVELVGTNKEKIINSVSELMENKEKYQQMSLSINPYGDGFASERIVNIIKNKLKHDT